MRFLGFWPSLSANLRYLCFLARSLLGQRVQAIARDLISKESAGLLQRHIRISAMSGNEAVAVMRRFGGLGDSIRSFTAGSQGVLGGVVFGEASVWWKKQPLPGFRYSSRNPLEKTV